MAARLSPTLNSRILSSRLRVNSDLMPGNYLRNRQLVGSANLRVRGHYGRYAPWEGVIDAKRHWGRQCVASPP